MIKEGIFSVTCPCCGSVIDIDESARVVTGHTPPPDTGERASFEKRMHALDEEKRVAQEKFEESIRAEKSKKEVLEKKFQDLFQKAKDAPLGDVQVQRLHRPNLPEGLAHAPVAQRLHEFPPHGGAARGPGPPVRNLDLRARRTYSTVYEGKGS